jgi:eukaryotic-like serine/threonine-protein kinase
MEYVAGRSLRERIDEVPLPVEDVVRLGIQAADALAFAHEHGVVHRDFKANAIVSESGWLKIVDFGLAPVRGRSRVRRLPRCFRRFSPGRRRRCQQPFPLRFAS